MSTKPYRVYTDAEIAGMVGRRLTKEESDALMAEALDSLQEVEARWRERASQALAHQAAREAARVARGLSPISEDELAFDAKCESARDQFARALANVSKAAPLDSHRLQSELEHDAAWAAKWREYEKRGWRQPTEAELREILVGIEQDNQREAARSPVSRFLHGCAASARTRYLTTTFPLRRWWGQRRCSR